MNELSSNVTIAFAFTVFAGLSTGIGSAIAFAAKKTNTRFLSVALGFSAGVMIYVSLVEILPKARTALAEAHGMRAGSWETAAAFFGGMFLIAMIDKLVPMHENPHEIRAADETATRKTRDEMAASLKRMGLMSALAIGIHNFPEGLATFAATLKDPALGAPIAVAIAVHNIPEGISVSVPVYYATGDRRKAFLYSFLSGLSEPACALIGYFLLRPFFNETVFGFLFASVAGIMVFISLDELLPAAEKYGEHHLCIYGLVSGMIVIAVSLLLFL